MENETGEIKIENEQGNRKVKWTDSIDKLFLEVALQALAMVTALILLISIINFWENAIEIIFYVTLAALLTAGLVTICFLIVALIKHYIIK